MNRTIAGSVQPGLSMDHEFAIPSFLLTLKSCPSEPNRLRSGVKADFLDWCEHNLSGYLIYVDGCEYRIRTCFDDYILLKLKYKNKETSWQII